MGLECEKIQPVIAQDNIINTSHSQLEEKFIGYAMPLSLVSAAVLKNPIIIHFLKICAIGFLCV